MKNTEDLLNQLKLDTLSDCEYLSENEDCFLKNDLSQFWKTVIGSTDMKKSDIINKADIGYTFFYDILKGKKHPSRDTLIRIFIAMRLDIDTCQEALRMYEWAALYPKIKRDSILIYCLAHNFSLQQSEELLEKYGAFLVNFAIIRHLSL